jgi:hypothetical protein
MSHCGNEPAADQVDLLTPLVRWEEEKKAPSLCAYPRVASYRGGNIERAESFECAQ